MAVVKDLDLAKAVFSDRSDQVAELEEIIKAGEAKAAEMQKLIDEQTARINDLEKRIADLKQIMEAIALEGGLE